MDYLTTKQAAEELGVSPSRIRQLIKAKRLPAVLFGRDRMIRRKDLEKVRVRQIGRPRKKKG